MKWIGLTGGLASGKSTVAGILRARGLAVIDADELARRAVSPGSEGLRKVLLEFGADLLNPDGSLNRQLLGTRVFGKSDQLARLEAIIHPFVQAEVARLRQQYEGRGEPVVFYDVPLLFEKKIEGFDAVVVVAASPPTQRRRAGERDGLSAEDIERRLGSQLPMEQKVAAADFVLWNDGSRAELEQQVDVMLRNLPIDRNV